METISIFDSIRPMFPFVSEEGLEFSVLNEKECYEIYQKTWLENRSVITCLPLEKLTKREFQEAIKEMKKENLLLPLGLLALQEAQTTLLGRIELSHYNPRNKSLEVGYYLLPQFRGKQIMSHALSTILNVVFQAGANKVYAQTASFNLPSINMLEKLGFKRDAVLREHHEYQGSLYDDYIYSITRKDRSKSLK